MESTELIRGFGILNRTFQSYISEALSTKDISYSDSFFLVNIGNNEGTNQEVIANTLSIDKAAVARSVKTMEKKGYLLVKRSKVDKRAKELCLSDSGKELYQFMLDINHKWLDAVMCDLNPKQINDLKQTIANISSRAQKWDATVN